MLRRQFLFTAFTATALRFRRRRASIERFEAATRAQHDALQRSVDQMDLPTLRCEVDCVASRAASEIQGRSGFRKNRFDVTVESVD